MASISTLRGEPRFVRWALAESVSIVGTMQTTVALPLLVYQTTGSAASTGALTAIRVVPYLLFGLIAGPLADRGNRRLLIIGGNVAEGLLVATIPLAAAFDALTMTHVYAVALLSATAFVFSDAAVFGAVPALVGRDRIAAANGLLGSLASGAEIIGPVAAGVLIATAGTTTTIAINAGTFLVAAAIQSTIGGNFRPEGATATGAPERTRHQLARARRFIREQTTLRVLLVVGFANSFAFGAVLGLLVPFAVRQFELPDDDGRIAVLYAALGIGGLIAGLALPRVFHVDRIRRVAPACLAAAGASVAALLAAPSIWLAAIAVGAFSLAISLLIVVGITYRQTVTPDDLRSTVNVIGRMISWGGQPFGAATGAVVAELASVRIAYGVAVAVLLVDATAAAVALRRGRHISMGVEGASAVEV
jgi:MFS family permease